MCNCCGSADISYAPGVVTAAATPLWPPIDTNTSAPALGERRVSVPVVPGSSGPLTSHAPLELRMLHPECGLLQFLGYENERKAENIVAKTPPVSYKCQYNRIRQVKRSEID